MPSFVFLFLIIFIQLLSVLFVTISQIFKICATVQTFQDYIDRSIENQLAGLDPLKKEIDHGKDGAIFIFERYRNGNISRRLTAEILCMIICYHHGGLADYIKKDEVPLFKRIEKKDAAYFQSRERFAERILPIDELDKLFDETVLEIEAFINKKHSASDMNFYIHLLIKYLYSCLIDADRFDTYLFCENKNPPEAEDVMPLWREFSSSLEQTK